MKNGWNEVTRLGSGDGNYPHVLVDVHGWCLRLGRERGQEKYYSSLPSLLEGLIEHLTRSRLRHCPTLMTAAAMLTEVRAALDEAAAHRQSLIALIGRELPIRPLVPPDTKFSPPSLFPPVEAA